MQTSGRGGEPGRRGMGRTRGSTLPRQTLEYLNQYPRSMSELLAGGEVTALTQDA